MIARRLAAGATVCCALAALAVWVAPGATAQEGAPLAGDEAGLYREACSSCHGQDLRGVRGKGPPLRGVGAQSADFYLSTGRMPLAHPDDEPVRNPPPYEREQRQALIEYIASFGGPPIPRTDTTDGSIAQGQRLFADNCSGCHQIVGQGGIIPPAGVAPALQHATATQVAEAIRIGPYTMPRFDEAHLDDREVASIARYVVSTRDPVDRGGWGIGNIGPVPEGMVAWLLAGTALLLVIRLLGERKR
jgi:ubiquinol-cytochrome c reductase cytochrome c subunit